MRKNVALHDMHSCIAAKSLVAAQHPPYIFLEGWTSSPPPWGPDRSSALHLLPQRGRKKSGVISPPEMAPFFFLSLNDRDQVGNLLA